MKKIFKKIYYIAGTIYRGLIGIYHNNFDKCPAINSKITSFSIGNSVQKKIIKCYKIGNDDKKILFVGGIHGNETGTVKLACYVANWFYDKNAVETRLACPQDKHRCLVSTGNITLFIISCLNPDGYELAKKNPDYFHRGKVGRFNANNVDLNRNFPSQNFKQKSVWKTGKDYSEKSQEIFCGEFGGSEPETRALIDFINKEDIKNLIIWHNLGSDVIINENDEVAKKWAETYYQYSKFKIRNFFKLSGSAAEWCRENDIHYMTVEGSSRWGSDWKRQRKSIENILKCV